MSDSIRNPQTLGPVGQPLPPETDPSSLPGSAEAKLIVALDACAASLREIEPSSDAEERLFGQAEAMGLLAPGAGRLGSAPATWWQRFVEGVSLRPRLSFAGVAAALAAVVALMAIARQGGIPFPLGGDPDLPRLLAPALAHAGAAPASAFERNRNVLASREVSVPPAATGAGSNRAIASRTFAAGTTASAARPSPQEHSPQAVAAKEAPSNPSSRYSEFMPMGNATPLRPEEFVQAVRVRIGAEDLWRLGMPVPPTLRDSRVTADFLVGEDGRARAVRLVSTRE